MYAIEVAFFLSNNLIATFQRTLRFYCRVKRIAFVGPWTMSTVQSARFRRYLIVLIDSKFKFLWPKSSPCSSVYSWKILIRTALVRPFALFFYEPIIQILGAYMAFIYGLFYSTLFPIHIMLYLHLLMYCIVFLTTMPTIFEGIYQQDVGIAGIHYLALGIGLVGGSQICAYFQDRLYIKLLRRNDDIGKPEFRLRESF